MPLERRCLRCLLGEQCRPRKQLHDGASVQPNSERHRARPKVQYQRDSDRHRGGRRAAGDRGMHGYQARRTSQGETRVQGSTSPDMPAGKTEQDTARVKQRWRPSAFLRRQGGVYSSASPRPVQPLRPTCNQPQPATSTGDSSPCSRRRVAECKTPRPRVVL